MPDVHAALRYDGAPVLKLASCFMAGMAAHPSAEPDTLVVRVEVGERELLPARPEDLSAGWYTLGPVSVEPDVQRQGIGKALIRAGLERLREFDAAGCIVVGDTNYYSQFGFVKAPALAPLTELAEHFMVLTLSGPVPMCRIGFHEAFQS